MEIRTLEYFLAVASEENITNASKILHISQPSLSRQMMDLEDELGVQLFIKSNRSTKLTQDGLRLKKRAEEIVSLAKKTELEFASKDEDIYGEINIGAGETIYFEYIAKTASRVQKKYPHIQFHFYSGIANDVIDQINNGLLEFGLLIEPVEIKNFNRLYLPDHEAHGLVVSKDSPLYQLESITEASLKDVPLIISRKKNYTGGNDWLSKKLDQLNIVATCNLSSNGLNLVNQGLGCFICVYKPSFDHYKNIRFIPFEPPLNRKWLLVWKKSEAFSRAHTIFLEEFQKVLDEEIDFLK